MKKKNTPFRRSSGKKHIGKTAAEKIIAIVKKRPYSLQDAFLCKPFAL